MRHNTTQNKSPAIQVALKKAYKLVCTQALLTLVVALIWTLFDKNNFLSVCYGGLSCVLPGLFFAIRFFSRLHDASPRRIVVAFYVGELIKMLVSVLILFLAIRYLHAMILPLFVGYIVASSGFWFAPMLLVDRKKVVA